jgi:hypothetical protein
MSDKDPRDDETQAMPSSDETQAMDPAEATQAMDADEIDALDETRAMASEGPTRRIDPPVMDDPEPTRAFSQEIASPVAPPTERIRVPVEGSNVGGWLIATLIVIALIVGAVIGYSQAEPSGHNVIARALVGPDGGVLQFDTGGRLEVPKGALPTLTSISIRKEKVDRRVRLGPEGDPRTVLYEPGELDVYVFEPTTLRFQAPVKIDLPRSGDATAVFIDAKGDPKVIAGEPHEGVVRIETTTFEFR